MRVRLKIRRLVESDEWKVSVFFDGKYNEEASYYTDDEDDAKDTKEAMIKEFREKGYEYED